MPKDDPDNAAEKTTTLDELIAERKRKRDRLVNEFERDPYGQRTTGIIPIDQARELYDADADAAVKNAEKGQDVGDDRPIVRVAGRVMQHRVMGNLIFMSLRDSSGDMQVAVSKKAVGQPYFSIAKMTDLGDLVTAVGPLGKTKTQEITVWAAPPQGEDAGGYEITSKSIAPPPNKFQGLTDPEQRYRKRYVDLYANPHVMETMKLRIRIIDEMRRYLIDKGFLEVETPMLQAIHGGAAARPFKTHHNALDLPLTMRIAPELYLKRLLVGGMPKVFEINRNFRNEGISPRHNPEFTMLEAYEAYGNWETMAELVEDMVCTVAMNVFGTLEIEHGENAGGAASAALGKDDNSGEDPDIAKTPSRQDAKRTIDLSRPWKRISMVDLVEERTGWKFDKNAMSAEWLNNFGFALWKRNRHDTLTESQEIGFGDLSQITATQRSEFCKAVAAAEQMTEDEVEDAMDSEIEKESLRLGTLSPAEQLTEVYEKFIEPRLLHPTFVTRVPGVIIPLAKRCADDDYFADVYELAINGVEISPGYTELNDPDVQEHHFREQVGDEEEQQQIDEDFLEALRVGMPPAGGMGLGIDRLVMMLTGATSIRDVILFPLMRPKDG